MSIKSFAFFSHIGVDSGVALVCNEIRKLYPNAIMDEVQTNTI